MDFASRHAVAPQLEPSPSATAVSEEPEYIARYLVVKHSRRGHYKRIMCISNSSIIILDPTSLSVTNLHDPMIREGKRSITRELMHVTEFVDKVLLVGKGGESRGIRCGRDTRVRFAENGNAGEVFDESSERAFEVLEGEEGWPI